jgi:hypothetical protein
VAVPTPSTRLYIVFLVVEVPLAAWMLIGRSDLAAGLFAGVSVAYAVVALRLKKKPPSPSR